VAELLVQILAFVLVAFGLGVLVGFLFWRFGRVCEPAEAHRSREVESRRQHAEFVDLRRELQTAVEAAAGLRAEVANLQAGLHQAWQVRDEAQRHCEAAVQRRAAADAELDRVQTHLGYLQRRVTELRVARSGVPVVDLRDGAGAA